jgi:hypothetical protein
LDNAICAITLDVLDTPGWKFVAAHLKAQKRGVNLFYASNIMEFLDDRRCWTGQRVDSMASRRANANFARVADAKGMTILDGDASDVLLNHLKQARLQVG